MELHLLLPWLVLCELWVLPAELEPAWEEERFTRALLLLCWLQGKDWSGSQPRHKPHLLPLGVGCARGADWGGNVTPGRPELDASMRIFGFWSSGVGLSLVPAPASLNDVKGEECHVCYALAVILNKSF